MLWDLIRDFYVEHVFGGWTSNDIEYGGFLGYLSNPNGSTDTYYTSTHCFQLGLDMSGSHQQLYMSFGDWLSTTATAISITIIVVLCCLFVYKIIKLIGGLIR